MVEYSSLSENEAKKKLEEYGFNEIKDVGKVHWTLILFRQIKSNFVFYLLTLAMIISFLVGKTITGYVILGVIVTVVTIAFIQEFKAEKAVEALKSLIMPVSIVIRDGVEKEILSKEIVPEDIIIFSNGEKISADCIILEEKDLLVDESILTGESKEIKKFAAKDLNNYSEKNILYSGSFIINGKCVAKVIKTGMNTKFGKIAEMISKSEKELPLQKKINVVAKRIAMIGLCVAILTAGVIFFRSEFSKDFLIEMLILIIAISVASFPEGFPVTMITTLSVGVYRMAQKNAIVNRMSVIETLGETTVICSDKTGTITKGEMTVRKVFADNKLFEVTGVGYHGNGDFIRDGIKINLHNEETLKILIKTAVICNDSVIQRTGEDKNYKITGMPTEAALLVMASKLGIYKEDLFRKRQEEITFSSERKMMSVVIKNQDKYFVYSKGALEVLLNKCKFIQRDNGVFRLLDKDRNLILNEFNKMNSSSLRTLALAYKRTNTFKKDSIEKDLVFLGFVGMEDPPREEIKNSLLVCEKAGISVKMITGDNKETAIAIAKQIGLNHNGKIMEGDELDKINDSELTKIVKDVIIFSRVRPEHKLRIVKALKENGEIVTMTGDGVNDSPALKEAHIGVAMGKNGTDVSRNVSDLTLKDDNFATIVEAIKEGRIIFNNIRKFVTYQLSCNVMELTTIFIGVLLAPIFGWGIPILVALQILFMNLVTSDLPAITLGLNKSSDDIMSHKPRKKTQILTRDLFILIIFTGLFITIFTIGSVWFSFNYLGQNFEIARTTALVAFIVLEIALAFHFRSFRKGVLKRSLFTNKYLVLASTISLTATLIIIYTPKINTIFETTPIPLINWLFILISTLILLLVFDFLKFVNNRKHILNFE